jgi:hypothetical protein
MVTKYSGRDVAFLLHDRLTCHVDPMALALSQSRTSVCSSSRTALMGAAIREGARLVADSSRPSSHICEWPCIWTSCNTRASQWCHRPVHLFPTISPAAESDLPPDQHHLNQRPATLTLTGTLRHFTVKIQNEWKAKVTYDEKQQNSCAATQLAREDAVCELDRVGSPRPPCARQPNTRACHCLCKWRHE